MTVLVAARAAAAEGDATPRGTWMAAMMTNATAANDWGRLTLRDGVLGFSSAKTEWRMDIVSIKRAALEPADRMVVESVTGEMYYVSILGPRMESESPRAALKIIQQALQSSSTARRER